MCPHAEFQRHSCHCYTFAAVLLICAMGASETVITAQAEFEPLVTTLGVRAFDVEYELWYYVNVVFESEVSPVANGYEYRYRLTNKGDTQVRVEWRALEQSVFADDVNSIEELRMGLLDPGTVSAWLVLTSSNAPHVDERSSRMFASAPSGNESVQFSGPAPAYIPEPTRSARVLASVLGVQTHFQFGR